VGDEKLVRGARKAFVAGGGFKGLDRIQWWKMAQFHRNFSHIEVKIDRFA
jgi:hypothetical protein